MSHFSVLVITDDEPDLEKILQPWHEYECTGTKDEYVIDVDCTEEVNKHLSDKIFMGKNKVISGWDWEYSLESAQRNQTDPQEVTWKDYYEKAGLSEDLEIDRYFGYTKKDGKWISYTNPNAQWDWWKSGGRWAGMLVTKDGAGTKGKPGVGGQQYSNGGVDQCQIKDLDIETMTNDNMKDRMDSFDGARDKTLAKLKESGITDQDPTDLWREYDQLKDQLRDNGVDISLMEKITKHERANWLREHCLGRGWLESLPTEIYNKNEYVLATPAFSTFAVVKDGKWYQKGEMGWWGMVSGENDEWPEKFQELVRGLSPETWITVVDCHI
ncbi:MAG: hypothetical protein V3R41_03795 [Gammaproteobacteria bacterium]